VHDGVVEGRRPCWSSDEAAPAGAVDGHTMDGPSARATDSGMARLPDQKCRPPDARAAGPPLSRRAAICAR